MVPLIVTKHGPGTEMLVRSLIKWGGPLADSDIWAFGEGDIEGARTIPLEMPSGLENYPLADKVVACAMAEKMANGKYDALVWMAPDVIVFNPPILYLPASSLSICLRPVHMRNVGSLVSEEPDGYWKRVYESTGKSEMTVKTFVEGREVRAYFNTHAFGINTDLGLMAEWLDIFTKLALDREFQNGDCGPEDRKIFLHQAVFSALVAAELGPEGIRLLPPEYNYPYNLQSSVPSERRIESLNSLVTVATEGRSMNPGNMNDIKAEGPLISWLAENV